MTRIRPTPAGISIIVSFAAVFFMIENRRLAVGFFIALAILAVVDLLVSSRELVGRSASVQLLTSTVGSPTRFAFTATAEPGRLPLVVQTPGPFPGEVETIRATIPPEGGMVGVERPDGPPDLAFAFRFSVACTWLGLVSIVRWKGVAVPAGMARGLRPQPLRLGPPPVADELARLREYVPGDRVGRIAWPITARTGRLHVRSEGFEPSDVLIRVDLGPPTELTDQRRQKVLQQAADVANAFLEQGHLVRLVARVVDERYIRRIARTLTERPHRSLDLQTRFVGGELTLSDGEVINREVRSVLISTVGDLHRGLAAVTAGSPLPPPTEPGIQVDPSGARGVG